MIDPDADLGRRAWLPCPYCIDNDCAACAQRTTCGQHWRYLLANDVQHVFLQCPACRHRWWADTGCGAGDRRTGWGLPDFPVADFPVADFPVGPDEAVNPGEAA
jgi:hypothetical protein